MTLLEFKQGFRHYIRENCPTLAGHLTFNLYPMPQCCGMLIWKKITWENSDHEYHDADALDDIAAEDVARFNHQLYAGARSAGFKRVMVVAGPCQYALHRLLEHPYWEMVDEWKTGEGERYPKMYLMKCV